MSAIGRIEELLADDTSLLSFEGAKISRDRLNLPGPDFVDRVWSASDRPVRVLQSLGALLRLGDGSTGHVYSGG